LGDAFGPRCHPFGAQPLSASSCKHGIAIAVAGVRYLSVCSGIEAATVAWHPLGWQAAAYSEIEAFPRAVLSHHYPDVPLHGDFTTIGADEYGPIDLLVGGTPCQSFSIAGLRGGLADDRGNLALEFLRLADHTRPRWLVWENVPGVLSSGGGRDFGSILGGLVELGYGFAYRVLDAQFFGVPQRRRRVFVVGYLGDWRRAAAVLFERHSLQGNPAPRRETGQVAPTVPSRSSAGGGLGTDFDCDGGLIAGPDVVGALNTANGKTRPGDTLQCAMAGHMLAYGGNRCSGPVDVATTLQAHAGPAGRMDFASETFVVADTLTSNGDAHSGYRDEKGLIAFSIMPMNSGKDYKARETDVAQPVMAGGPVGGNQGGDYIAQAINWQSGGDCRGLEPRDTVSALTKDQTPAVTGSAVRRLTPRECERLQGFPDDYTLIPWRGKGADQCPDGPRYKALGNSMAVPVMRWIGERIAAVEALETNERLAA
jgi:DNA (cytosine-5)-methyltransferase 1